MAYNPPPFFPQIKIGDAWYPLWYVPDATKTNKGIVSLVDDYRDGDNQNKGAKDSVALTPLGLKNIWKGFSTVSSGQLGLVYPYSVDDEVQSDKTHFLAADNSWIELDTNAYEILWNDDFEVSEQQDGEGDTEPQEEQEPEQG